MTSKADLIRVQQLEQNLGERELYSSDQLYKNAPKAMGLTRGIRVNLTSDILARKIDINDFGGGDLCTRKQDVDEAKVRP